MRILSSHTEETIPFVLVEAKDENEAETFAQNNAELFDDYFEDMTAGAARSTITPGVFRVPFTDSLFI